MLSIILIAFFGGLVYQSSYIMRMPKTSREYHTTAYVYHSITGQTSHNKHIILQILHKNIQKRTLQIYINCETLFIIDTKLKYFFANFLWVARHSFRLESIKIPKVYHKPRMDRTLVITNG
jgi:hypothetical protein